MTKVKLNMYGTVKEIEEMTFSIAGTDEEFMWIEFTEKDGTTYRSLYFKGGI